MTTTNTTDADRCFACGRKLRTNRFLAHVAGEEQNVYVGPECHDQMQLHRAPWTPMLGNHGAYCPGCNRDHERIALRREECIDAVSFRSNADQPVSEHAGVSTDGLRWECARLIDGMLATAENVSERLGECAGRGTEAEGDEYARLEGEIIAAARVLRQVRKGIQ